MSGLKMTDSSGETSHRDTAGRNHAAGRVTGSSAPEIGALSLGVGAPRVSPPLKPFRKGSPIEVAEGGLFKGDAEVDHAHIAGTFEGTLRARQTLDVAESGHVKGTIFYKNISISSGGRVEGTIDVIDAERS
jgi:hypothetical protein